MSSTQLVRGTILGVVMIFFAIISNLPEAAQIVAVVLVVGAFMWLRQKGLMPSARTILWGTMPRGDGDVSEAPEPIGNNGHRNHRGHHEGVIVKMGAAPFEHDKANSNSFYITLRNAGNERTLWGVDLGRVARQTHLKVGDHVELAFLGKQHVVIDQPVRDDQGNVVGHRKVDAHRNTWNATVLS